MTEIKATPMYTLGELFTPEEIEKAFTIISNYKRENARRPLNDLLVERVVNDAMPRINQVTGQDNHAPYMAYVLEAAFLRTTMVPKPEKQQR